MGIAQCDEINCKNYRSGECSLTVGRPIELIDGLNCKFQKKVHLSTRVSNVRDYKDRFILRMLQDEARRENPGFRLFDSGSQRAKVFWIGAGYNQRPVGYYIYSVPASVLTVPVFSQVYVTRQVRKRGLATQMVEDFKREFPNVTIGVESPRFEMKGILRRLGMFQVSEDTENEDSEGTITFWAEDLCNDGNPYIFL